MWNKKKVVMGNEGLKAFYGRDPGFQQFVDRHGLVAGNPELRQEYEMWRREERILAEEFDRRKAEGVAEGEAKNQAKVARLAFQNALPGEDFSSIAARLTNYGIPADVIQTARAKVENRG